MNELKLFLQLFLLGAVLSTLVMYITEATKKVIVTGKAWLFTVINLMISMGFGIGWARTFSAMDWKYAVWLGVLLFLGSTGLYTKLENSDGFWGKTVKSYTKYLSEIADGTQITSDPVYTTDELEAFKQEMTEAAVQEKDAAVTVAKSDAEKAAKKAVSEAVKKTQSELSTEKEAAVRSATQKAKSDAEAKAKAEAEKLAKAEDKEDQKQEAEAAALKAQIEQLQKELEKKNAPSVVPSAKTLKFRMPVNYIGISAPFGQAHRGVDFGYSLSILGANQPIYAAMNGKVVAATKDGGGAGTYVKLQFDDADENCTWYTYYKHLSRLDVAAGDTLTVGQQVGLMGDTGDADGNHLHFDLVRVPYKASYDNSNNMQRSKYSLDPLKYLIVDDDQTVGDVTATKYKLNYA